MAEGVVSLLLEKVLEFAQNEISKVVCAERELAKLEQELKSIQPILRDAHAKLFTSKENAKEVKGWILRLNDVAYDALDLIDSYRVKSAYGGSTNRRTIESKVRNFLKSPVKTGKNIALRGEISSKIKEINERLNALSKEKDIYGLGVMGEVGSSAVTNMNAMWERRQTTATINVSNIIGREEDQETMVNWLLEEFPRDKRSESVSVAAIVGMGGMGKTTLAKAIYNSSYVAKSFNKCMWVCVSEKPCLSNLLKKILEEVDRNERGSFSTPLIGSNSLSSRIINHLKDQKFLLVLDDVWDCQWWNELTGLWRSDVKSGSKVLVTTRDMGVANAIKSDRFHELKRLNLDQSWQLFVNEVLRKGEDEKDLDVVREIGEGIVRKCGGLPLALSTVGGMMRQRDRKTHIWKDVYHSPFWRWKGPGNQNDILSAIALSYMNIPFPLKQCLTYCCIFPKDFEMDKG